MLPSYKIPQVLLLLGHHHNVWCKLLNITSNSTIEVQTKIVSFSPVTFLFTKSFLMKDICSVGKRGWTPRNKPCYRYLKPKKYLIYWQEIVCSVRVYADNNYSCFLISCFIYTDSINSKVLLKFSYPLTHSGVSKQNFPAAFVTKACGNITYNTFLGPNYDELSMVTPMFHYFFWNLGWFDI